MFGSKPKIKYLLLITTLLPRPEKRELSQHPSAELGCPAPARIFSFRRLQLSPCSGWAVMSMSAILQRRLVWCWTDKFYVSQWTVCTTCLRYVICSLTASILMALRNKDEILWADVLPRVKLKSLRTWGSGRAWNEPGGSSRAGKWPASCALTWIKQARTSCMFNTAWRKYVVFLARK